MLPSVQSWALVASCPDCFSWWKHCSWYDPSDQRLPSASPTAFNTPHSSTQDTVLQTSGFLRLHRQPSTHHTQALATRSFRPAASFGFTDSLQHTTLRHSRHGPSDQRLPSASPTAFNTPHSNSLQRITLRHSRHGPSDQRLPSASATAFNKIQACRI